MDIFKAVFLTFFACVLTTISINAPSSVYAEECNFEQNLDISLNSNVAVIKNNSESCSFTVTLAAYDMPYEKDSNPNWIADQKLLDFETKTLTPGEQTQLTVDDSGSKFCRIQADLFRGSTVLEPPFYVNNLADAIYTKNCAPSPTNTPVPSATPTQEPQPSTTPVPTSTPSVLGTVPPAPGGDGRSDGLGCSVNDCSGNKSGGGQVLGTTTAPARGGVLPFTGVEAGPWAMLALGIIGIFAGSAMHVYANKVRK